VLNVSDGMCSGASLIGKTDSGKVANYETKAQPQSWAFHYLGRELIDALH